jgi:hypothetical protein
MIQILRFIIRTPVSVCQVMFWPAFTCDVSDAPGILSPSDVPAGNFLGIGRRWRSLARSVSTTTAAHLVTGPEPAGQDQAEVFRARLVDAGYKVDVIAQPELSHGAFRSGAPGTVEALIAAAAG